MSILPLNKNWSNLLLPFAAGIVLTALAFSLFTGASKQSASSDLQGGLKNGTFQPNPFPPNNLPCNTTNCQLMAKLNQMHGNGGNSTWTLKSLGEGIYQTSSYVVTELNDSIRGTTSYGSPSSWTLESLAARMPNDAQFAATAAANLVKNNAMGPSSWTLEALASQIYNVCQN